MAKHVMVSIGAVFLATFLFSTPLIMKYHVHLPQLMQVATGDVVILNQTLSTLWCQGVELSSESTFRTFLFEGQPRVENGSLTTTSSTYDTDLPNQAQEYRGFHLLQGSEAKISACVRIPGAAMTVIKGYHHLRRCLREHKMRLLHPNDGMTGENSLSQSESDDETSSISSSQGVVSNETDKVYSCRSALYHVHLPAKYSCGSAVVPSDRKLILSHDIGESGRYYYVLTSDTYLDIIPNKISVNFTFNRTHYDHSSSIANCSDSGYCELSYSFGSHEKIVLEMSNPDGILMTQEVKIACKPRKGLYFFFYASFTIVIFLCAFY